MTLYNHLYQQELRERFLQKIIDDWDTRFLRHGDTFVNLSAIGSKNGFVQDVADAVETELTEQVGKQEATRLTPSKDTLRRLLFENDAETSWQTKTREALCRYAGFSGWDNFKDTVREHLQKDPVPINIYQVTVRPGWFPLQRIVPFLPLSAQPETREAKPLRWRAMLIGGLVLATLLGIGGWTWQWWQSRPFRPEQVAGVQFRLLRVEGKTLPQTLIIEYDFTSLGIDTAVVALDWVDKEYWQHPGDLDQVVLRQPKGRFTHPFTKPTYGGVRLVANNQVIGQIDHTTTTNGWVGWTGAAEGNTQALAQIEIQQAGLLKVPLSARKGIPGDFYTHVMNQQAFNLDADELVLEARVKNPFSEGGISCFETEFNVQWGKEAHQTLSMLATRPGCGANTFVRVGQQIFTNGDYDLSGLSVDFESWHILKIRTYQHTVYTYIDNQLVFQQNYTSDLKIVKAIHLCFKGTGSVDWVRLANSRTGKMIYQADF